MYKKKLNSILNLIEEIKSDLNLNIISEFLDWFYQKLELHFNINTKKSKYNKWEIYFINLWKNIWSELNKTRPCIIYSDYFYNSWNTVTIIPLKSYKWRKNKNVNIFIKPTELNNLNRNVIVDISWISQKSKKRIKWYIWKLDKNDIDRVNVKLIKYLWLKK